MNRASHPTWLLMAAGDNRGHGGNEGYDDQVDAYYSWDSNVPNAKKLAEGDPIALWDKERILGVSVIEKIETWPGTKQLNRCPSCGTTRIATRATKQPRYRCAKKACRAVFDRPRVEVVEVELYRARYDAGWTALDGLLSVTDIRPMFEHPGDINAMRPIQWALLERALIDKQAERAVSRIVGRAPDIIRNPAPGVVVEMPQGFTHSLVRVRRGQQQFRDQVLGQQGNVCAFTGRAPERVLEAGHLYSYAALGEHRRHGGLMLRRDVHRLFDDGSLAVDPVRLRVDVSPELAAFPQYAELHGDPLRTELHDDHVNWLDKHWNEHRVTVGATASGAP